MLYHNRIIVECLHGHWSAWWADRPQIAFGGATPGEAVDRLYGAYPERVGDSTNTDE